MEYGDPCLPLRYWEKVYPCPISGCWLWGAAQHDSLPYGIWTVRTGKTGRAHVSAFVASGGVLTPEKPHVLHSCDQASCVWPEHLRAGTQAENMADAKRRRRLRVGRRSCLDATRVVELRERYGRGESRESLSAEFAVGLAAISFIVRGIRWPDAGGPLTFGRHVGRPNPSREKPTCKHGHELTPDNVRLKPNPACQSGFERRCIACDRRTNQELAARRKAARALSRKRAA